MSEFEELKNRFNEVNTLLVENVTDTELIKEKILLQLELAEVYTYTETEKAKTMISEAYELSELVDFDMGKGYAFQVFGNYHHYFMHYRFSEKCFEKAVYFYSKASCNDRLIMTYHDMCRINLNRKRLDGAFANLNQAKDLLKKEKHEYLEFRNLWLFGDYCLCKKQYKKSIQIYLKALQHPGKPKNKYAGESILKNLLKAYIQTEEYNKGLEIVESLISLIDNHDSIGDMVIFTTDKAFIKYQLGKKKEAFALLNKAEKIIKEKKYTDKFKDVYGMKAQLYSLEGNYIKADKYSRLFRKSIDLDKIKEDSLKLFKYEIVTEKHEMDRIVRNKSYVNISHELRQPLMVLQGNLDMMSMEIKKEPHNTDLNKFEEKMNESITKINTILQKLLEIEINV